MDPATLTRTTAEEEIRGFIDRWVAAAKAQDLETVMACYTPDVVAFDAIGAFQFRDREAYRKHWETCFTYMQGEMIFDISELAITTGQDLAFFHYVARCGGECNGEEKIGWMRVTGCLRKSKGEWRIVHEHFSAPFDPMSGQVINTGP